MKNVLKIKVVIKNDLTKEQIKKLYKKLEEYISKYTNLNK